MFRRRNAGSDAFEREVEWGPTGWRPMPVPSVPQQIGVYGDAILNQTPGIWPSTQLDCGVNGLRSTWVVLTASSVPYWQQAQQEVNVPGAQRMAGKPSAGMGPIGARTLKEQVFRAQVAQSGLKAMSWAQALKGWN